jgi:putative NADPH-quinone reductase
MFIYLRPPDHFTNCHLHNCGQKKFIPMKILLLISHGDYDGKSNAHVLARAADEALRAAGHETRVVDLVKVGFDKVASRADIINEVPGERFSLHPNAAVPNNLVQEIVVQQQNILWATHVIVFGPVWYHGLPASFYAYYERVFTMGFSFDGTHNWGNGFFKDKKVMIVVTAAAPAALYTRAGGFPLEGMLYAVHAGHFRYNGFQIVRSQGFYGLRGTDLVDGETLEKWKRAVVNIDKRPILVFQEGEKVESDLELFCRLPDLTLEEAIGL